MTIRALAVNNKGQSYEAAQLSADNDNHPSDLMVLPHSFAEFMRVTEHGVTRFFKFDHEFKTGSTALHILDWPRIECCQVYLPRSFSDAGCPLRLFPRAP